MKYTIERAYPDANRRSWTLVGIGFVIGFLVTRFLVA